MKTPPTYWKVKASPIVREFMRMQRPWNATWEWYSFNEGRYNGFDNEELYPNLPTLTPAQFKKHFYDPWKAGQGEPLAAKRERVARTRPDSKRVTLAKHNRITAELQRQCEQLGSELAEAKKESKNWKGHYEMNLLKVERYQQALDDYGQTVERLEADRDNLRAAVNDNAAHVDKLKQEVDQQHTIIMNKETYIKRLENDRANAMDKIELLKKDITDRNKSHEIELNYLLDSRNMWQAFAWVLGFASALLGIAQLIGG
jgi:hypothetical protein